MIRRPPRSTLFPYTSSSDLALFAALQATTAQQLGLPQVLTVAANTTGGVTRSEEHTSELQSQSNLVCRLLLEKKKKTLPAAPQQMSAARTPTSESQTRATPR